MRRRGAALLVALMVVTGSCTDDGGIDFEWLFDAFLIRDLTRDPDPAMRAAAQARAAKEAEDAAQRKLNEAHDAIGRLDDPDNRSTDDEVSKKLEEAVELRPYDARHRINQILWGITVAPNMGHLEALSTSRAQFNALAGSVPEAERQRRWEEMVIESAGSLAAQLPPDSDRRRRMTDFFCGALSTHRSTYGNLAETQTFLFFLDQSPCN